MKRIIFFASIFLSSILLYTSCADTLDTTPKQEFSDEMVWEDPALVETLLNELYFRLDEPLSGGRFIACIVDEAHYRGHSGSFDFNNCLQNPDNLYGWGVTRERTWQQLYKSIRSCNLFFENVETINFGGAITDGVTQRERMTGEAHFLRAYHYFNLFTMYGGVPLITKVYTLTDDFAISRNTYEETVDFIVSECDKAAALLPERHSGDNHGRATRGAALALKSRLLLYAASDLAHSTAKIYPDFSNPELLGYQGGDRTARWRAAKDAAKAVMDMGLYELHKPDPVPADNIADNFVQFFISKESEEDIFIKFFVPIMGQMMGLYSGPNGFHNWGSNAPLADLVDDYEMADGTPFDWNNPGMLTF